MDEGLERGSVQAEATGVNTFLAALINPCLQFLWLVAFTRPFDSFSSERGRDDSDAVNIRIISL